MAPEGEGAVFSLMPSPRHIAITGASGLLGTALQDVLAAAGTQVTPLVRRVARAGEIRWDPAAATDLSALGAVDAVVHLAGENLAARRWTPARKEAILASRRDGTRHLVDSLLRLPRPPGVLLSASAVGIYGDRGDEVLTEASSTGNGFLADVVRAWEDATAPAKTAGIRVVNLRFGIVLTPRGGALQRMLLPFRLGLGARLGTGAQWMSWIALDDAVAVLRHSLAAADLTGPVNATAPEPVTNAEFTTALARALHRPAFAVAPAPLLRILLGELAEEALLASQRALPARLNATGYAFRFPSLTAALTHLLP